MDHAPHRLRPETGQLARIGDRHEEDQRKRPDMLADRAMIRPVYLTKSVRIGIILTLTTAGMLIFLVFFAKQFYSRLVLANVIAFQLSFIWTCAELLDGPGDDLADDEPKGRDFTH
jgi:hypothetical protein